MIFLLMKIKFLKYWRSIFVSILKTCIMISLASSEQVLSFIDLLYESIKVLQVALDFFSGQIDQHTSNLGSIVLAGNLLYIFEDKFSHLSFVVRVSLGNSRCDHESSLSIILLKAKLLATNLYSSLYLRHHTNGCHESWLTHGLHHSLLQLLGRESTLHLLGHLWGTTLELTIVEVLPVVVLLLRTSALVRGALSWLLLLLQLCILVELGRTSVVRSHIVIASLLILEFWLYEVDQLLQKCEHFWLLQHLHRVTEALSLIVLVVSFVSELFMLSLSDLLDLVVTHIQVLAIKVIVVKLSFSLGSLLWVLEAHESIDDFVVLREELDVLNFSIPSKKLFKLLFSSIRGETFNEQVASLFGVLVPHHFLLLLNNSVFLLQSFLHI